jgi:hypothetical protein
MRREGSSGEGKCGKESGRSRRKARKVSRRYRIIKGKRRRNYVYFVSHS